MSIFEKYPKITLIFIIFIIFVIIDLICGIFFIPKKSDVKEFRIPHSYYHHGFLPNKSVIERWGDKSYKFYTNSLSFRDNKPRKISLDTKLNRTVFIGDSFTEGVGFKYDDTFVGIINKKIDRSKNEILNAAVISYSPRIYYLKTKYFIEGMHLKFNRLVVLIDISDIQDEIVYEGFNENEYDSIMLENIEKEKNTNKINNSKLNIKQILKNVSFFYYSTSLLYNNIKNKLKGNVIVREEIKKNDKQIKDSGEMIEKSYTWSSTNDYYKERDRWMAIDKIYEKWGKKGLSLAEENMQKLVDLCKKNNIELIITVYPWPNNIRYDRDKKSMQETFWEDFCKKNSLKFIDLFPLFINNEKPETIINNYYIKKDDHWNKNGHLIVAEKLYKELF